MSPRGIVKFKIAEVEVPEFVTDTFVPATPVTTLPTAMVAAVPAIPCEPCGPVAPVEPGAPVAPWGIVKFNNAAFDVPTFVTAALVPGALVVVDPTVIVAAAPSSPFVPFVPAAPVAPVEPVAP